jgi:hypothetical protein
MAALCVIRELAFIRGSVSYKTSPGGSLDVRQTQKKLGLESLGQRIGLFIVPP